jgi:hypothetical protein
MLTKNIYLKPKHVIKFQPITETALWYLCKDILWNQIQLLSFDEVNVWINWLLKKIDIHLGSMNRKFYQKCSILNYQKGKTWHLPPVNIKSEALNTFFFIQKMTFSWNLL